LNRHITKHRAGFAEGLTPITRLDDPANETGLAHAVVRLDAGATWSERPAGETALLLMSGRVEVRLPGARHTLERASLFDESASCVHVAAGTDIAIRAGSDAELMVFGCANASTFPPRVFQPADVPNEHRGLGQVRNRSLRFVRTIFDARNSPREVQLVLGEVVTLPGGWSSYPPHHHAQPEIYHYRFTAPQGYGHGELGDSVFKLRQYDSLCIGPGQDHAQCAAPGYGMYYSWVIRHLPDRPYTVPEFTPEHAWTMKQDAAFWWPGDLAEARDD
jgi:5-deoxy-glucuronate isomerase